MKNHRLEYEGVAVGKGELFDALKALKDYNRRPNPIQKEQKALKDVIRKIFADTTARYEALYSAEDRAWFAAWRPIHIAPPEVNVNSDCVPQT